MNLYQIEQDGEVVCWEAHHTEAEALAAAEEHLGSLEEGDVLTATILDEGTAVEIGFGDGDDNITSDMWTEFQRKTEPGCVAISWELR